jgi:hypothetical protein
MFVDAEADPEEVVTDLEAMLQALGGLSEDLARFNQVRGVFGERGSRVAVWGMAEPLAACPPCPSPASLSKCLSMFPLTRPRHHTTPAVPLPRGPAAR